jgi:hypothetical protein
MTSSSHDLLATAGLDPEIARRLTAEATEGADDGELYLEYRQSESLMFDNGRLKSASFDTTQGFGLRAVTGEVSGFAHAGEISEAALKRAAEAVKAVKGGRSGTYAAAHRWWDPNSEFKPLHDINPLRLDWIDRLSGGLAGKRVVDVGCGGGILAESMAMKGAAVTGIDLSEKPLKVAKLHQLESGVAVDYRLIAAEDLAAERPESFDVVTCMEMLEHVPDPASIMAACARMTKPEIGRAHV